MADYGGRGFVMALPYIVGVICAAAIGSMLDIKSGWIFFLLTIGIGQLFKIVFKWK